MQTLYMQRRLFGTESLTRRRKDDQILRFAGDELLHLFVLEPFFVDLVRSCAAQKALVSDTISAFSIVSRT